MIILYIGSLVGILKQVAIGLITIGIVYAIPILFKQIPLSISKTRKSLSITVANFIACFNKSPFFGIPAAISSFALSMTLLLLFFNIWDQSIVTAIVIVLGVSIILFPFIFLSIDQYRIATKNRRFRYLSIGVALISVFMISSVIEYDRIIPPRTDNITIHNLGTSTINPNSTDVELIEIKDRNKSFALSAVNIADWEEIIIDEETEALRSSVPGQELQFFNQVKGPNSYDLLFNKTSVGGIVRITINNQEYQFDLNSTESDQMLISLRSFPSFHYLILLTSVAISTLIIPQLLLITILISTNLLPQVIKNQISPFFFLVISLFVLYKYMMPLKFFSWDEFSHWGIFLKEIFIKNKLPVEDFCTVAPFYIPGITLFEYFFLNILGYKEGYAYFAHALFILSEVIVVLVGVKQVKLHHFLTYIPSILIYALFFPLIFFTLYVDATLGLLFGVGLIISTVVNNDNSKKLLMFLIFCGLQLIKTWGMVFSLFLFAINFFDTLISFQWKVKDKYLQRDLFRWILLLVLSFIIIQIPWMFHSNTIRENSLSSAIFNIKDWEASMDSDIQIDAFSILKSIFKVSIQGRELVGMIGTFSVMIFSLAFYLIGILVSSKDRKRIRWHSSIALFSIMNVFLLFFVYMFWFSAIEATRLASFERYTSEYLIGWLLFLVFEIAYTNKQNKKKNFPLYSINAACVILTIICSMNLGYIHFPSPDYIDKRKFVNSVIDKYDHILLEGHSNKKVFHIHQDSDGYEHHILRYELCPNLVQYWGWSYGQPYTDQDLFTIDSTVEELEQTIVNNFDYVLITNSDNIFWEKYGVIFINHKQEEFQLFEVMDDEIIFLE